MFDNMSQIHEHLELAPVNNVRAVGTWAMSLTACSLVGLTGIIPTFLFSSKTTETIQGHPLRMMLSFAVGSLLGDVFLHLLPEAWSFVEKSDATLSVEQAYLKLGLWVVFGLFTFVVLEILGYIANAEWGRGQKSSEEEEEDIANAECTASTDEKSMPETNKKGITGYLNLLANGVDNFSHGLAVAASFLVGTKVGLLTTFAIIIHEVPHEFGDFAILINNGFTKREAMKAQISTASIGILGCVVALCAESGEELGVKTAWILPFTAGGFLHVALVSILPELVREADPWESLKQMVSLVSGIAVMALVSLCAN